MTRLQLGRFQRGVLDKLAASPGGLTPRDLACLSRSGDAAKAHSRASRVLYTLNRHGLVTLAGRKGSRLGIWAITATGREAIAPKPPSGRDRGQVRRERRNAVLAALTAGMGPDTPGWMRRAGAIQMQKAGCRVQDIALVFAVPEAAAERLLGGAS
jgi:hypothetical protein